jgi:two-component system, sensor histidine kinase ChiS
MQKSKDLFFTNITHEFRTPLTIIRSAAQDIIEQAGGDESIRRDVMDIMTHGSNLLVLINQILDIAKITSGVAHPQWKHGDIAGFISMICESYEKYAAGKGIRIAFTAQERSVEMDFIQL